MKLVWGWDGIVGGVALLAVGFLLGLIGTRDGSSARKRVRELEDELTRMRDRQERYRESVAQHFGRTSDIFRNLTGDYRALYAHLADGARSLASDDVPALRFEQTGARPPTLERWAETELADLDDGEADDTEARQR